jgi:hypothetical protein
MPRRAGTRTLLLYRKGSTILIPSARPARRRANLNSANLSGASLDGANFGGTTSILNHSSARLLLKKTAPNGGRVRVREWLRPWAGTGAASMPP